MAKLSKPVKRAVNALIHAQAEDKYQRMENGYVNQPVPLHGWNGIGSAGLVTINTPFTLFPAIDQGVGSYQRLGNKIKVKSLVVNWQISILNDISGDTQAGSDSIPLLVRLLVLKSKSVTNAPLIPSTVATSIGQDLFNYGSGQYGGATNRPADMDLRVNRKAYTVVTDKVMKLEKGDGADPISTATGGTVTTVSPTSVHRFTTRIPCGTPLVYPSEGAIFPDNFAPFFSVTYTQANADCPIPPSPAYLNRVLVHYDVHCDYEDS